MPGMKHSPGPWRWNEAVGIIEDAAGRQVCDASEYMSNAGNARLIAAAPELLSLVRRLLEHVGTESSDQDDCYDAERDAAALLARIDGTQEP